MKYSYNNWLREPNESVKKEMMKQIMLQHQMNLHKYTDAQNENKLLAKRLEKERLIEIYQIITANKW